MRLINRVYGVTELLSDVLKGGSSAPVRSTIGEPVMKKDPGPAKSYASTDISDDDDQVITF